MHNFKYISHRGNLNGRDISNENKPQTIERILSKTIFDIEIDVWYYKNTFYLGHDLPQYKFKIQLLQSNRIWCHAKTEKTLQKLIELDAHCFFHTNDDCTLTSRSYIWTYPGKKLYKNSICVLPENNKNKHTVKCAGICSDYIQNIYDTKINNF
jgi:hypothetical protein